MKDVFISYTGGEESKKFVDNIETTFKEHDIDYFIDKDLQPSDKDWEGIFYHLFYCEYFLLVLSKEAVGVMREIEVANALRLSKFLKREKKIISVFVTDKGKDWFNCKLKEKPFHFDTLQYVDYRPSNENREKEKAEIVNKILGRKKWQRDICIEGRFWEFDEETKIASAHYNPEEIDRDYRPFILSSIPNLDKNKNIKCVSIKVKILHGSEEWKVAIILRKSNGDINSECLRFYVSDKENPPRDFSKERFVACYFLSLNTATLTFDTSKDTRPNLEDSPEFELKLKVENSEIHCSVLVNGNPKDQPFIVSKRNPQQSSPDSPNANKVIKENDGLIVPMNFDLNHIRQVCFCAYTRVENKKFSIELSDPRIKWSD